MRFDVGYDLDEFRRYHRNSGIHKYLKSVGVTDVVFGELGPIEVTRIERDPSHLIV